MTKRQKSPNPIPKGQFAMDTFKGKAIVECFTMTNSTSASLT